MKKKDVQIGHTYLVKVAGKIAQVRIDGVNPLQGFKGVNLATGRAVWIKSAARLRADVGAQADRQHVEIPAADVEAARELIDGEGFLKSEK